MINHKDQIRFIIKLRKLTDWGSLKIKQFLNLKLHQNTINKILKRNNPN